MVSDSAYGSRLGPKALSKVPTRRWMALISCSTEPIRTPNAMSNPTSAMISPNPPVIVSTVVDTPSLVARPRYAAPSTSEITGLKWKRTMKTTTASTATTVLITIHKSDIGRSFHQRVTAAMHDGPV